MANKRKRRVRFGVWPKRGTRLGFLFFQESEAGGDGLEVEEPGGFGDRVIDLPAEVDVSSLSRGQRGGGGVGIGDAGYFEWTRPADLDPARKVSFLIVRFSSFQGDPTFRINKIAADWGD